MLEIKDKSEKKKIFQWTYQHDTAEERIDKLKISQQKVLRLKHKKWRRKNSVKIFLMNNNTSKTSGFIPEMQFT